MGKSCRKALIRPGLARSEKIGIQKSVEKINLPLLPHEAAGDGDAVPCKVRCTLLGANHQDTTGLTNYSGFKPSSRSGPSLHLDPDRILHPVLERHDDLEQTVLIASVRRFGLDRTAE
jgi:hypothetical protein